jgi:predicted AlkP superfamily pyrophosphatase or phosphodiesterase
MQKILFLVICRTIICLFVFFYWPMFLSAQTDTSQQIIAGRINSAEQQQKPYIILISADGFRYDLADKYNAAHLLELRSGGVRAAFMKPCYPSLTFPNHYSIATGLYPSHHGLVSNAFYDRQKGSGYKLGDRATVNDSSWYGGTPIWVLAERQKMLTASFYWVGSEAAIQGIRPTYYYKFNNNIGIDDRIQVVKNWLMLPEAIRPHLITFYLPQVDHEEHMHGIDSKEAETAVHLVDDCIGQMVRVVDSLHLPVSFIFVSDHGMAMVDTLHTIAVASIVDTSKFIIPGESTMLNLYAKDKKDIRPAYQALKKNAVDFDVYLPDETPARWHYRSSDDRFHRLGDIILVSKFPKVFRFNSPWSLKATHGFDNDIAEMQATFYAWGPAFRQNMLIPDFENIQIYPLIATILGLSVTDNIDGSPDVLQNTLR